MSGRTTLPPGWSDRAAATLPDRSFRDDATTDSDGVGTPGRTLTTGVPRDGPYSPRLGYRFPLCFFTLSAFHLRPG